MAPQTNACFELCSGETWRAPWPMYAALRDADPAHHVEAGDYWVLSRYSDVQAAVLDTARYSSASGLTVSYDERAAAGLATVTPLVMMDPPEHTEFRSLISRGYTPRRVAEIEPQVRQFVRSRLDAIAELGECDIVTELFRPVPSFVVAGYLGVPEADRAQFESWTRGIVEANAAAGPTQAADAGHRRRPPAGPRRTAGTTHPLSPLRRRLSGRHFRPRALHPPLRHPPVHHRSALSRAARASISIRIRQLAPPQKQDDEHDDHDDHDCSDSDEHRVSLFLMAGRLAGAGWSRHR